MYSRRKGWGHPRVGRTSQPRPLGIKYAFTLLELLVVIAVVTVLAALLFPVFVKVRSKARETSCISNLRQIGMGVGMYTQDYDGFYPFAVDPQDRAQPESWSAFPEFMELIPRLNLIQTSLQPYVKSNEVFHCPSDTGLRKEDFPGLGIDASPSSYAQLGTSYYYRTELAARHWNVSGLQNPSGIDILFDGDGKWHGSLPLSAMRYSTVFGDGHARSLTMSAFALMHTSDL